MLVSVLGIVVILNLYLQKRNRKDCNQIKGKKSQVAEVASDIEEVQVWIINST